MKQFTEVFPTAPSNEETQDDCDVMDSQHTRVWK